jgi:DMSO/TMAO reductase YedYZ molybdopterin-dependent catalytic subunit
MNRKNSGEQKGEHAKRISAVESEVLIEKVREIELAKEKANDSGALNLDRNDTSKILNEKRELSEPLTDNEAKQKMSRQSRRGFLIGGAAALVGVFGWRWMPTETKEALLRRTFEFNEKVSQIFYRPTRLAPEFPLNRVGNLRVNGGYGMSEDFDPQTWRLQVVGLANPKQFAQYADDIRYQTPMNDENEMKETAALHETTDSKENPNAPQMPPASIDRAAAPQMPMSGLLLTLDDIKSLPRVEMTTELKCIEGWSVVVNWTGAKFSDFIDKFQPATRDGSPPNAANQPENLLPYISMVTPDGGYYVGMDMPSVLHPQTLLAYEMNGAPLTLEHGAPLRLVTATKYGIKQIKRIGRIAFTAERPADYWAERGYDWYAGH